ncbi:hypothetical protein RYZ26_10035 [Terasakiella sp. A23]|uniref:hypothetical protein n=1 Tax=Terasakiella sp. FCG-A23 TaxID=3080561 RepID=UPI0029542273|nr:hypothetical protein [Terasakiella sp. A23]MDV7339934.1 hypothetical protein [Terasakiella sp. A23]
MKKKPGVVLHSSGGYRYQKRYPKDVLEAIAYLSTHSQWQDIYFQYADLTFYRYDFHTKDIREANNAHAHVASKAQAFFDQVRVDYATAQNTSVPKRTALSLELATELADEIREREKRRELKEFAKDYDIVKKLPAGEQDERLQDILIDLTEQAQNYGISEHPDTIRETQRTTTQALEDAHLSHITYDQEGYGLLYGMIQNALKDASEYAVSLYENPNKTLSASQTSNLQPVAHVNAPVLSSERTVDAIERVWEEYKVRYTNLVPSL